ncbi:prepilin-type N-terminal cleavage/methylation domain-containing protein [Thiohalophilus thiocyanatoxydans]|uniref:MSHA pilin protein MshC n=1 Tax=Thiohalophilus thiocyanatoxydans TaxID=381308 RepID=A0A4R8J0Z0_9GAMM|nr:prepilin-type N-terminal cleavage/methylation domain-containing protein [Thiohalophilus thiocyanatoxydans]TDY03839.1 MSHA pilin protein MshC [Thiohalophilus thiocyanatoxydans]
MNVSNNRAGAGPRSVTDPMRPFAQRHRGFTLVELIAVIIIIGILAVVLIPRFIDRGSVTPGAAQAQVIAAARHAQQLAMNNGGNVLFATDNSNKRVTITHGGSGSPMTIDLPDDITITAANISYDSLGDAHDSSGALSGPLTLSIANGITRQVCIETTGYAHGC